MSWERYPRLNTRPQGLALTLSDNDGESFSEPVQVPASVDSAGGTNGSHQGLLMNKLDANNANMLVIANSSLLMNVRSRVWFMRARLREE